MGLFILRLAEDGPAIKDGRIHVSSLLFATFAFGSRLESSRSNRFRGNADTSYTGNGFLQPHAAMCFPGQPGFRSLMASLCPEEQSAQGGWVSKSGHVHLITTILKTAG